MRDLGYSRIQVCLTPREAEVLGRLATRLLISKCGVLREGLARMWGTHSGQTLKGPIGTQCSELAEDLGELGRPGPELSER